MSKRKLLQALTVYTRDLNPDSKLLGSLSIKGGSINIYNYNKLELTESPPADKDAMILDQASPLSDGMHPVDTISDFILYENVSGTPKVVSNNVVED